MSDTPEFLRSYGPNVWLIDEMYRLFRENPEAVSRNWREFFADYRPTSVPETLPTDSVPARQIPPKTSTSSGAAPGGALPGAVPVGAVPPGAVPPGAVPPGAVPPGAVPVGAVPFGAVPIRGPQEIVVDNMEKSRGVPTATSTRIIPVKLLEENRRLINDHLSEMTSGKVSFTHLIAWAILRAFVRMPAMTVSFFEKAGVRYAVTPEHINLGIAVDVPRNDGSRGLLVPNIRGAEAMDFVTFFAAYNEIMRKVTGGRITPDDFTGTSVTITNTGTIGTVHSIPRLLEGQSAIIGTGAIAYPAEWTWADPRTLAALGISKVMMVTSTYDHRVIQGAQSGLFLQQVHRFLEGEDGFYEDVFASLRLPHAPVALSRDSNPGFDNGAGGDVVAKQARVLQLINMYRVRGHLLAHLNPLEANGATPRELDPGHYGLTVWDYDREFITGGLGGKPRAMLRDILAVLRETYCRTVGIEYMHIQDPEQKQWIQEQIEGTQRLTRVEHEEQHRILDRLNAAEAFEKFLQTKYVGHKRYGLEGAESLIPMLDRLLRDAGDLGIREAVIGMAHRGRLNTLANVIGMGLGKIFREFEGELDPDSMQGSGDVKYHLSADGLYLRGNGNPLRVILASNPSHLEVVNPVVEGIARALHDRKNEASGTFTVLPVVIHGDAAMAGQGVVAETLNFSMLPGYRTGGTVHIVINNGIGFTTSPASGRSSTYATDVARMVQAPILHVNADDPEACVAVTIFALLFRERYAKDVVVDLLCYRRHGHNENDDPSFTQPKMYARIREHRSARKLYTEALVNRGFITLEEAEASIGEFHALMEKAFDETRESAPLRPADDVLFRTIPESSGPPIATGVPREALDDVLRGITGIPEGFQAHPKLRKLLETRAGMLEGDAVDWATAEALAFGSLLREEIPIRLSGQDSRRGTFSQRHLALIDQATETEYVPLRHLARGDARLMAYDSLLSELAVVGFEYGYSVAWKEALVLWEAQFGDFVNGAQILVDQFIAAAEDKWKQTSGLVLLLPHGFEGQGPEHSSARIERFLTLCAENNMRVAVPTTAAQYFHLLRRQALHGEKKPLIAFTPKSLLRAEAAKSPARDFESGSFRLVIDDPHPPASPTRLLLCTGKVAYDLLKHREKEGITDTAIARLEQLYPFPEDEVLGLFARHDRARDIRWVQEEPQNMGAWNYVYWKLRDALGLPYLFSYRGRAASASPATGSQTLHQMEQEKLVREAFL